MQDIFDAIKSGSINGYAIGGKTIEKQLKQAAEYLKELIKKHLQDYYNANPNKRYKRTGRLMDSVVADGVVSVEMTPTGSTFCTYVRFDENALHRSGFGVWRDPAGGGKYDEDKYSFEDDVMNVALGVNYGYTVQSPVWFRDYEKFGQREGAYFVERAIDEFNSNNTFGMFIDKNTDIIIN